MSRCKGWGKHNGQAGQPMNSENYILNRKCAYKLCNLLAKSTGARNKLGQAARQKYCAKHTIARRGKEAIEKEKIRCVIKGKKYGKIIAKRYRTDEKFREVMKEKNRIVRANRSEETKKRHSRKEKLRMKKIMSDPILYREFRDKTNKNEKNRLKTDIKYRIRKLQSARIRIALHSQKVLKDKRTIELLGTKNINTLRNHIEKQFKKGMSWKNNTMFGWHTDHIIPLSSFDLTKKKEQLKAFNYKNLQPLWWRENIQKGNKILI